jgi:uncharacterized protein YggU (UPF0235/DUF167 family)
MIDIGIEIFVKGMPNSTQIGFKGLVIGPGERTYVKIGVKEIAAEGKANKAISKILSQTLQCPIGNIFLRNGVTSTFKIFVIKNPHENMLLQLHNICIK